MAQGQSRARLTVLIVSVISLSALAWLMPRSGHALRIGPCERSVDGVYESSGPATIERFGDRYVLTLRCDSVHQIYIRPSDALSLEGFVGKPVRVRYRYVNQANPRTRCVQPPCPPAVERLIEILSVERQDG